MVPYDFVARVLTTSSVNVATSEGLEFFAGNEYKESIMWGSYMSVLRSFGDKPGYTHSTSLWGLTTSYFSLNDRPEIGFLNVHRNILNIRSV